MRLTTSITKMSIQQGLLYHTEPDDIGHTISYQFSTNMWYRGHIDPRYAKPVLFRYSNRLALV